MTTARRLLVASTAIAATVPALPATTASADPIIRCSAAFIVGPVRCAAAAEETRWRDENPEINAVLQQYVDPLF
jgi:post-segregation antitoxin (ccd killing protein)